MKAGRIFPLFWLLTLAVTAQAQQRPNILLLMAEDMGSRVGAFGDPVALTPNLDALAAQGVRYSNTFTTAGVCAPSRAAHILGMHQVSTGTQHMRSSTRPAGAYFAVPPEQVKAYPELLRRAGYYTYTDQKLDYQFSGVFSGSGPFSIWDAEAMPATGWRQRDRDQPFFGFKNFQVTHESGVFRPLGSWPHSVMHLAMQFGRWWALDGAPPQVTDPASIRLPPYYPDTPTVRADLARHYDNIAAMDVEVGEILAQLEADGLTDSTVLIWTSDHGDGLPRAKRELYDSGIKVPMIIRWPPAFRPAGVEPGALDTRLISFVDLAPTILSLAGVPLPEYLHGRDFSAPDTSARETVFASRDRIDAVDDRQRAVRDQRYKYIRSWYPELAQGHYLAYRNNIDMIREMQSMYEAGQLSDVQSLWFEPVGAEQLYDLRQDPFELNNLASDPAHQQELQRLRALLEQHLATIGDWSEQPEAAMVARFQPGGEQVVTPPPRGRIIDGRLTLDSALGHSLGYRVDAGAWRLYGGTVPVVAGAVVQARAVRYGWEASEIVDIPN